MKDEVAWVECEGRAIAYQVIGSGPPDVLLLDHWWTHLDLEWDDPFLARRLRRMAASARVIRFDKSGMGLSDRRAPSPSDALDIWADEAIAVLDALDVRVVRLLVSGWSGPLGVALARRHPDRFDRIAFATAFARLGGAGDPPGVDPGLVDAAREFLFERWGTGVLSDLLGLDRSSLPEYQVRLEARYERSSVSPGELRPVVAALTGADEVKSLAAIESPTLVVHRPNPLIPEEHSRFMAVTIPRGEFECVDERDWRNPMAEDDLLGDELVALAYLTGTPTERDLQQELWTVVFIDIVGSTPLIHRVGDREWSDALEDFTAGLHMHLAHYRGRLAGSAGDGFFLAFGSPRQALRFALALSEKAESLGLSIRTGIHTGECHASGDELRGLTVHATARIMSEADAGEVFTSSIVRQLLTEEPVEFQSVGTRELRGVPGSWELFSVGH